MLGTLQQQTDLVFTTTASDTVNPAANAAEASKALGKLEAAPPGSMAGYSRELFPHWSNVEEFG